MCFYYTFSAETFYFCTKVNVIYMDRLLIDKMLEWKNSSRRKPLIIWGARQVGKTWLMKEFGRKYFDNTIYISFYNNRRISQIFEKDYNTKRIIESIEIELKATITPQKTLVVFDEVQNSLKVVESLKYFFEESPQYCIVVAGSLLGTAIHEGISFPVGKVDELHLYPLCFTEFLRAMNESKLADFVIANDYDRINDFGEKYAELLKDYIFTGGMPEVVEDFRINRDYSQARQLQLSILNQYEGDFGKHISPTVLPRIRLVWNSLPMQLAKENRKFFFGQVKSGGRMKDFEIAIQWLVDCGLVYKVHRVSKPVMPLKPYADFSAFKLYLLDIGLLGAMCDLDFSVISRGNDVFVEFKGALAEQYVLQQLVSSVHCNPYYYASEKSAFEVDFVIQQKDGIVPIEVKSEENLKAKSLRFYCEKFQPSTAIRTSMSNYRKQDWLTNVPLWGVECIGLL